jgi:hypothetical protein
MQFDGKHCEMIGFFSSMKPRPNYDWAWFSDLFEG